MVEMQKAENFALLVVPCVQCIRVVVFSGSGPFRFNDLDIGSWRTPCRQRSASPPARKHSLRVQGCFGWQQEWSFRRRN